MFEQETFPYAKNDIIIIIFKTKAAQWSQSNSKKKEADLKSGGKNSGFQITSFVKSFIFSNRLSIKKKKVKIALY